MERSGWLVYGGGARVVVEVLGLMEVWVGVLVLDIVFARAAAQGVVQTSLVWPQEWAWKSLWHILDAWKSWWLDVVVGFCVGVGAWGDVRVWMWKISNR